MKLLVEKAEDGTLEKSETSFQEIAVQGKPACIDNTAVAGFEEI